MRIRLTRHYYKTRPGWLAVAVLLVVVGASLSFVDSGLFGFAIGLLIAPWSSLSPLHGRVREIELLSRGE